MRSGRIPCARRAVYAVRVGGGDFVSAKKFLKEFQKFFPHSQNLIHPFGILVLLSEKGSARPKKRVHKVF